MLIDTQVTTIKLNEVEREQLLVGIAELMRKSEVDITQDPFDVVRALYMRLLTH